MTPEEKYYELLERRDRALDTYMGHQTEINELKFREAEDEYASYCMMLLEKLIEENSDVLSCLNHLKTLQIW